MQQQWMCQPAFGLFGIFVRHHLLGLLEQGTKIQEGVQLRPGGQKSNGSSGNLLVSDQRMGDGIATEFVQPGKLLEGPRQTGTEQAGMSQRVMRHFMSQNKREGLVVPGAETGIHPSRWS